MRRLRTDSIEIRSNRHWGAQIAGDALRPREQRIGHRDPPPAARCSPTRAMLAFRLPPPLISFTFASMKGVASFPTIPRAAITSVLLHRSPARSSPPVSRSPPGSGWRCRCRRRSLATTSPASSARCLRALSSRSERPVAALARIERGKLARRGKRRPAPTESQLLERGGDIEDRFDSGRDHHEHPSSPAPSGPPRRQARLRPRCTPPIPPVAKTRMLAGAAMRMVAATVVAPRARVATG